jgi:hypothetical protein
MKTDGKDMDALIESLAAEGPKKPMPHPLAQGAAWFAFTLLWMLAVAWIEQPGPRPDMLRKMMQPFYLPELALLLAMTLSAGLAALFLSRPDGFQKPSFQRLPFLFLGFWAVAAVLNAPGVTQEEMAAAFDPRQFDCVKCLLSFAVPPGIAMFLMVRRGAPAQGARAGLMAAWAAASFAYLCMRVFEPNDNPVHLLIWHALPVFLMCLLGWLAGRRLLRWK